MGNCFSLNQLCGHSNKNLEETPVEVEVEVKKAAETLPTPPPPPPPAKIKIPNSEISSTVSMPASPKGVEELKLVNGYGDVNTFTYNELRLATKNFRPDLILGEGGFGVVYKGVIDENVRPGFKSTEVAVKVLDPEGFQGDREWLAEVNYLGQFSHPNLVKLIGFCCEDEHRLLVYEYMACGSLEKHLFRRVCLTMPWLTRMKIALGAAKGLAFLHGAERPIIYRDFKTSNILLDAEYNAKLSDFGLAKEGPIGDQTHVSTRVMGTYGYAAPEYVATGHLTAMSDVYGFGVVLLEMLIGRRATDKSRPSREHNLVEWARPLLIRPNKLLRITDPRMEGQYSNKTMQMVANLAYQCLSQNPKGRPTMKEVVRILEPFKDMQKDGDDISGAAVTLYEASPDPPGAATGDAAEHERKRNKHPFPNGRSKSEPYLESNRFITSLEPDGPPEPQTKAINEHSKMIDLKKQSN
ncbi:hypothetical protein J5N97_003560 [Dioscorea zingiberensis]|uniref:non-specific serine/threonine protein kinase n=1 Tax=Dioscorea zingiberensis TaxID=325984 RepID=A0A9D5HQH0_9LILI|nr:hypothetical protein J5N97_003560 [Dioscorea zingiberensis]